MKSLMVAAALATSFAGLPSGAGAQDAGAEILDVSSFMMPPRVSWAVIGKSNDPNVVVSEMAAADGDLGFRVLHLRASVKGRKQAAIDLAKSGLVKSGDILLSFRPLWDRTLAYAHMQLGISHSGLAFIVSDGNDPFVMTLESPISYSSPLNAPEHYGDLDTIHVVRPTLSDGQTANLEQWARLILTNSSRFDFFADYSLPMHKRGHADVVSPTDIIVKLARVANGSTKQPFASYCSEFVWSLLGLRDCKPNAFDAACVKPIFETKRGMLNGIVPKLPGDAGMVQGAEAALARGLSDQSDRTEILTGSVFVDILTDPSELAGRMSSGHRKVAEDNRDGMKLINSYYASGEPAAIAEGINGGLNENVSPTSFLIRSNAGLDGLQYVGTIVFDR